MRRDYSFGIIPLRKQPNGWQVFLIKHKGGHWGFPKGHAEKAETPRDAACRELQEETGLKVVAFLSTVPLQETFSFFWRGTKVEKTVTYFVATVAGDIALQQEEVQDGGWIALEKAHERLTFPEARSLCQQARELLSHEGL